MHFHVHLHAPGTSGDSNAAASFFAAEAVTLTRGAAIKMAAALKAAAEAWELAAAGSDEDGDDVGGATGCRGCGGTGGGGQGGASPVSPKTIRMPQKRPRAAEFHDKSDDIPDFDNDAEAKKARGEGPGAFADSEDPYYDHVRG